MKKSQVRHLMNVSLSHVASDASLLAKKERLGPSDAELLRQAINDLLTAYQYCTLLVVPSPDV